MFGIKCILTHIKVNYAFEKTCMYKSVEVITMMCRKITILITITLNSPRVPTNTQSTNKNKVGYNSIETLQSLYILLNM